MLDKCHSDVATYHSRKKKAAILFKILVRLVDGKILKWKGLSGDSLLKIWKMSLQKKATLYDN